MNILVVDDNVDFCDSLKDVIELNGHNVTCANGGRDALSQLVKDKFDLILLDLVMPGMDGVTTIGEIRKIPVFVPIIIVSAYSDEKLLDEAFKAGATDKISKPVDPAFLLLQIENRLG